MGHVLGAEKRIFLIRGRRCLPGPCRLRRWNPVNPCQIGLPGVAYGRYYTRARAYIAYAAASSIFGRFLSAAHATLAVIGQGLLPGSPRALGCCIDGVCGPGDYPLPDLARETSRGRSATEKMV